MRTKRIIQNALRSTCLPSVRLSAVQKLAVCIDSKFGGRFYLPKGENIPTCPEGEHMRFLAQINFGKMPHLEGFPREGLLQLFVDTNQERFEAKIDDPNTRRQLYSVRYYPSPDATLQQTVELQRFAPTKVITTVTVNGEQMTEEEYRKRLSEAQAQDGKPVSVFMSMMEGKGVPPSKPSLAAELRRNAKFHNQTIPGHLDLPWLEGKIAFHSDTEIGTVYVGMEDVVSDMGYETVCRQQVTPELVQQSGYDLENNESALDDLCWDFGNWGTKLGGHPAIHQADSRLDLEGCADYAILLFQYDFTTKKELEADTFQFFIKPQDLENACFDDILFCRHNAF